MRMDIADLCLFLAIAEAGSITAGATQANLALGSASERLRSIEADAGTLLLNRHPRGVSLTEAGAALAHHARLILQQQAQLRGELQAFAQGARGTLHLYANTAALTGRRLDVRIRMKTFEGVCIMVGHGIGVGIVPRTIARQHRRSTHTVAVPLADAWAQRRLCACFAEWAQLSPAMRSLLHHLGVQAQKIV